MKIGELAQRTGVSVQTVRYYERRGLLEEPARTRSGYRSYEPEAVRRLRFILSAKGLGFTLSEIGDLVELGRAPEASAEEVRARAREKIRATKAKITSLRRLLAGLERVVAECDAGGSPHTCALLHVLNDLEADPEQEKTS